MSDYFAGQGFFDFYTDSDEQDGEGTAVDVPARRIRS